MGRTLLKTNIVREKDKLYYCGTDEKGNITICETPMVHGRKKKKK